MSGLLVRLARVDTVGVLVGVGAVAARAVLAETRRGFLGRALAFKLVGFQLVGVRLVPLATSLTGTAWTRVILFVVWAVGAGGFAFARINFRNPPTQSLYKRSTWVLGFGLGYYRLRT